MGLDFRAQSEKGADKWHFGVWNRIRVWRTGRHTPTKNSQQYFVRNVTGVEGAHARNKSSKLQMFSDCYKQWIWQSSEGSGFF